MKFMNEYSWKQALFSFAVLIAGATFIFAVNSSGFKNPAWDNFFYFIIPSSLTLCFMPVVIAEKIIPTIQNKLRK